jgi:hypothetical protein
MQGMELSLEDFTCQGNCPTTHKEQKRCTQKERGSRRSKRGSFFSVYLSEKNITAACRLYEPNHRLSDVPINKTNRQ